LGKYSRDNKLTVVSLIPEIRYVSCPVCGERVRLVFGGNWHCEGTCPQC